MAWAMVRSLLFFAVQLAAGLGDWSDAQIREKFPLLRVFDDALPSPLLDALEHARSPGGAPELLLVQVQDDALHREQPPPKLDRA